MRALGVTFAAVMAAAVVAAGSASATAAATDTVSAGTARVVTNPPVTLTVPRADHNRAAENLSQNQESQAQSYLERPEPPEQPVVSLYGASRSSQFGNKALGLILTFEVQPAAV